MRIRLLLSIAVVAMACGSPAARAPSPLNPLPGERQKLVVERIRTQQGPIADSLRLVIRDDRTWSRYRDAIARPGQGGYEVDFDTRVVVLVALGRQPNNCCTVRIDSAVATSADIAVFVSRSRLGEGCVVSATPTHPFDAVRIPRRELPVRYVERESVSSCRRPPPASFAMGRW
jgi:hypothetical protein